MPYPSSGIYIKDNVIWSPTLNLPTYLILNSIGTGLMPAGKRIFEYIHQCLQYSRTPSPHPESLSFSRKGEDWGLHVLKWRGCPWTQENLILWLACCKTFFLHRKPELLAPWWGKFRARLSQLFFHVPMLPDDIRINIWYVETSCVELHCSHRPPCPPCICVCGPVQRQLYWADRHQIWWHYDVCGP